MRKVLTLLLVPLLFAACSSLDAFPEDSLSGEGPLSHGLIRLGEKLEDPYTVSNMQTALSKAYPSKGRVELSATDLYVRFLPTDDAQLQLLRDRGLYLMDHPDRTSVV